MSGPTPPASMRALVLHAVGDLRVDRVPRPEPGRGTVLVRVGFCGVCGSDIPRIFVKGAYTFPLVCGHEFAGTVEEVGPGVDDLAPGERVAVFPLIWCGQCPACEQGRYVQCSRYDYLGSRSNGAFAELVVAPRRNLLRVPDGVDLEDASMTEPAAVALHALRRVGGVGIGDVVAVFGAGPIGVLTAQWARAMGAGKLVLFDVVPAKLDLARGLGFRLVHDSREVDPLSVVRELTGDRGAHVCVEAAGVPVTTVQALSAARHGGRVILLGNPSADVTLPADVISRAMRREITIHGTWNSSYSAAGNDDDWSAALDAMAQGVLRLRPLVSHRVGLDEAVHTLAMMRDRSQFYSKVLVTPGRP